MLKYKVKAILFDLDGVLVDSLSAWFHVFNDTLEHFGLKKVSKKEFRKDFGAPIEYDMKRYYADKTIREVVHTYNKNFKKWRGYVKLNRSSLKTLKYLKNNKIKISLITNSSRFITNMILNHFKIRKYFDIVVTMEQVKRRKPAPDMILKACRLLHVEPENTILIGDTKNDMIAGKRAGCITVGYKVNGDYKISNLKSIFNLIK